MYRFNLKSVCLSYFFRKMFFFCAVFPDATLKTRHFVLLGVRKIRNLGVRKIRDLHVLLSVRKIRDLCAVKCEEEKRPMCCSM